MTSLRRRHLVRVTEVKHFGQGDMVCDSLLGCRLCLGHNRLHGPVTEELAIDPSSFEVARSQLSSFASVLLDVVVSYPTVACFGSGKGS